jgi:hypothetical protein
VSQSFLWLLYHQFYSFEFPHFNQLETSTITTGSIPPSIPTHVSVDTAESLVRGGGKGAIHPAVAGVLTRVVNNEIFPKQQFVIFERELFDEEGILAQKTMKRMNIKSKEIWPKLARHVRTALNQKRNNSMKRIREMLERKYKSRVVWNN